MVKTADDAADPAKATSAVTDFIGQGYKIIAGSASSGVAAQVAPLAAENQVLFISGPAATDALTGINKYTFRSGRQSYQDVATAATFLPDLQGKKVTVFTQDNAFGQGNVASVTSVFGAGGATVTPLLVPATATDLVPFAKQAADAGADLLFVAWAGANSTQMWDALNQQGAFAIVNGGHRSRRQGDPGRVHRGRRQAVAAGALLRRCHRQRGREGAGRRADGGGQDAGPVLAGRLQRRVDAGPRGRRHRRTTWTA